MHNGMWLTCGGRTMTILLTWTLRGRRQVQPLLAGTHNPGKFPISRSQFEGELRIEWVDKHDLAPRTVNRDELPEI